MQFSKKILTSALTFILATTATAQSKNYLFKPYGGNFYIYGRGSNQFIINQSKITRFGLGKISARIASAKRINSAADDPSGLAVAEKMKTLIQQFQRESQNKADMRNMYNHIEAVVAQDTAILRRIRQLILRSSSGILSAEDRSYNQGEINQLLRQINMNARFAQFNTRRIIPELTTANLGLDSVNVVRNLYGSMALVDAAMQKLTKRRVVEGAKANILTYQIKGKYYQMVNLISSESRIRDQDIAEGVSELMTNSILLKNQYGVMMRAR